VGDSWLLVGLILTCAASFFLGALVSSCVVALLLLGGDKPVRPVRAARPADPGLILLSLVISEEMHGFLSDVAAEHGMDRADALRRAVGLLKLARGARAVGLKVGAFDDKGEIVREFTGI
jgi:hypothetical protein